MNLLTEFRQLIDLLISNGINPDDSQQIAEHIQNSREWEKLTPVQQISALGSAIQMCNQKMFEGEITAYFKDIIHAAAI